MQRNVFVQIVCEKLDMAAIKHDPTNIFVDDARTFLKTRYRNTFPR